MRGLRIPPLIQFEIPDGPLATRETLKHMRRLVQIGKTDFRFRDLANQITAGIPAKDWQGELAALCDWVRQNVRYALDPNDLETIQAPNITLELGYGDCDDLAILLATLCECAGHPTAFAALGFGHIGEYAHVLVIASGAGEQEFVALDPTENHEHGWYPPGVTCELFCPITQTAADLLGQA